MAHRTRKWHAHLRSADWPPGALIYYQGTSEPELSGFIANYLQLGMTFYDVGAHIGEYALRASLLVGPGGCVHAFEPQPDMLELLRQNVSLNRLGNVTVNGCAMTNQPGTVEFNVRAERAVSSLSHAAPFPEDGQRLRVPAETLDAYSAKTNSFPHLIKIDVEGAEHLVLQGASQVLSAPPGQAPALVFEYSLENYRAFGVHPAQVTDLLLRHGYTFHIWKAPGLRPATDVDLKETIDLNLIALKM